MFIYYVRYIFILFGRNRKTQNDRFFQQLLPYEYFISLIMLSNKYIHNNQFYLKISEIKFSTYVLPYITTLKNIFFK